MPLLPLQCKEMIVIISLSLFLLSLCFLAKRSFFTSVIYFASLAATLFSICREEEHSKLSAELERQPKVASRGSHIQRIKEITKNSRKQDADIERILKETRELQLESNSIQERLHRTYAVVDEMVFRYRLFSVATTQPAWCPRCH